MAATYTTITELEFDSLLKHSKGWGKKVVGNEFVYSYVPKKNPDTMVKVYSSIKLDGVSKTVGCDSIKVCAINTKTERGIIKSSRINRTAGWDVRTKAKILEVMSKIW
tara:strand:- start:3845 stop:4168 length:324 start_codon:yes stop_codon:yes gene_type:complete